MSRESAAAAALLRRELGDLAEGALARWASALFGVPAGEIAARVAGLRPQGEAAPRLAGRATAWIPLHGPAGQLAWLALDARVTAGVLGVLLRVPLTGVHAARSAGELGLLTYAIAALVDQLGNGCPWSVGPARARPPREAELPRRALEVQLVLPHHAGLAWLLLPEPWVQPSSPEARRRARRQRLGRLGAVEVPLAIAAGAFSVPLAELESVEPGDLIVAAGIPRAVAGCPVRVLVADGSFSGRVQGDTVSIDGPFSQGVSIMSKETVEGDQLADRLPVQITVEVGRVQVMAAQVLDLGPGDVLTLERPVSAEVELRVGGRLVARGELVDVEGEAGVRLLEVYD
ncbi:MAG: type III secretion system cytoplasmic ring protein SctQ [Deltaproteobacteria bacterium]|nr:type III secretion system cytoplasmic ring protein SctQ [Deltaproteobacteria bacterium]